MPTFNPNDYLMKLQGKDYLPVQARLLWLRTLHPDATLTTELVSYEPGQHALFRATISIPGRGSATGHGSEDPKGFRDFIEKAETKAIGRALGALGFGTQFTDDFDTPVTADNQIRIVDSPVERKTTRVSDPVKEPLDTAVPADLDRRFKTQADRLTAAVLKQQSEVMFNISESKRLSPEQKLELVMWAEAQL